MIQDSSRFFANRKCEYYPCHQGITEINCLFCYCPLYHMQHCPGNPSFKEIDGGKLKICSNCTFPHKAENYDKICAYLSSRKKPR